MDGVWMGMMGMGWGCFDCSQQIDWCFLVCITYLIRRSIFNPGSNGFRPKARDAGT